jgi:hypothetical protein
VISSSLMPHRATKITVTRESPAAASEPALLAYDHLLEASGTSPGKECSCVVAHMSQMHTALDDL